MCVWPELSVTSRVIGSGAAAGLFPADWPAFQTSAAELLVPPEQVGTDRPTLGRI